MKYLFLLSFIFVSVSARAAYQDELIEKARSLNLSQDKQWLNLLHFKPNFFGLNRSQVASKIFFLSDVGYKDPQKEMEETLKGFFEEKPREGHDQVAQCQFPARFVYLNKKLGFDTSKFPKVNCERFKHFFEGVNAKSVSVVFSSYYLNNPSSMFGHTLLRLNKQTSAQSGERFELLDYGINFAAEANVSNPVLYAIYGLAGMFKGTFISIPYYYKVREYNDFDSRDLWEYEIKLSQEEIDLLVAHLWEMGPTYFDYFYLTQNCSYHIFTVIDAAAPQLDLADRTRYYVIPAETIKVLDSIPGLVTKIQYRPSLRTVFDYRVSKLSREEKKILAQIVHDQNLQGLESLKSPENKAKVLDAALDYVDFSLAKELSTKDPDAVNWKQKLLVARSQQGIISETVQIIPDPAIYPNKGHGAARVSLAHGVADSQSQFTHIGFRFALHDLNDRFVGYPEYAHIDFLSFEGRFTHQTRKFEMEEASLISITSLNDFTYFHQKPSWHARLGGTRVRDASCDHCFPVYGEAGGGIAKQILDKPSVTPYLMFDGDAAIHADMYGGAIRLGVGPKIGLRIAPTNHFVVLADMTYRYYFPNNRFWGYRHTLTARYAVDSHFAFNLKLQRVPEADEALLGVMYYF